MDDDAFTGSQKMRYKAHISVVSLIVEQSDVIGYSFLWARLSPVIEPLLLHSRWMCVNTKHVWENHKGYKLYTLQIICTNVIDIIFEALASGRGERLHWPLYSVDWQCKLIEVWTLLSLGWILKLKSWGIFCGRFIYLFIYLLTYLLTCLFNFATPRTYEVLGPVIKPVPQQWPEPQQWQH